MNDLLDVSTLWFITNHLTSNY